MASPIRLEDLKARLHEINDMIEDLALEREAIINLMKVLRKGQPVREAAVDVDAISDTVSTDGRPPPSEAIKDTLEARPGEFTRKGLVNHLEHRVASEAENVRNVLYTQLRRDERSGQIWKNGDGLLYLSTHPKARAAVAEETQTEADSEQNETPAPASTGTGARDE